MITNLNHNKNDVLHPQHILNNVSIFSNIARFNGIDKCRNYAYVNMQTLDAYQNYSKEAWDKFLEKIYNDFEKYCEKTRANNLICHEYWKISDSDMPGKFLADLLKKDYTLAKRFAIKYSEKFNNAYYYEHFYNSKMIKLLNEINHNFYRYGDNKEIKKNRIICFTTKSTHKFNINAPIFQKYLKLKSVFNEYEIYDCNGYGSKKIKKIEIWYETIYLLNQIYGIFDNLIDDIEPEIHNVYHDTFYLLPKFESKYECLAGIRLKPAEFFARNPDKMDLFIKKCMLNPVTKERIQIYFLRSMVKNVTGHGSYRVINEHSLDKLKEINVDDTFIKNIDCLKQEKSIETHPEYEKPYSVSYIDEKIIGDMKKVIMDFFEEFPGSILTGSTALCFYNFENGINNLFDPNDIDIIICNIEMYSECTNKYSNADIEYDINYDCSSSSLNIHAYIIYKKYKINILYCDEKIQKKVSKFDFDFCGLLWDGTFSKSSEKALIAAKTMKTVYSFSKCLERSNRANALNIASRIWKYNCRGYQIDLEL
jgi:hypothetical protein